MPFRSHNTLGALAAGVALSCWAGAHGAAAGEGSSLGGSLALSDYGSFFVHGRPKPTRYSGAGDADAEDHNITVGQMYVQYMIPQERDEAMWPIIMVHGGTHSGKTYETTPDGREGWFTYFARQGIPAYVVDTPGRGRSGFDRSVINEARITGDASRLPGIGVSSNDRAWTLFRFGPSNRVPFDDTQFPVEAADQYFAQLNPSAETTLEGGEAANTPAALAELIEKVGPVVLMLHSRSGRFGLEAALEHPELVKAVVAVEPISCELSDEEIANAFARIPYLVVFGDHLSGIFETLNAGPCPETVARLEAAGGTGRNVHLPELGMQGNSHMIMLDRNNLEVADFIIDWVRENAEPAN